MNKTALILIAVMGAGLLLTGLLVFVKNYGTFKARQRFEVVSQVYSSMPGSLPPGVLEGWCGDLGMVPVGTISAVAVEAEATVAPTASPTPTKKGVAKKATVSAETK